MKLPPLMGKNGLPASSAITSYSKFSPFNTHDDTDNKQGDYDEDKLINELALGDKQLSNEIKKNIKLLRRLSTRQK